MPSPEPEVVILRELLVSESGFVSGTALARQLGVSRVAVWGWMERMRAQGFAFEAVRRRGYRLTQGPAGVHPWLLRAHLRGKAPPDIHWLPEVDSTNSEAERRLAAGEAAPFVVVAGRQTAGRGRLGRHWHSEGGGGLYLSFGFRPNVEPRHLQNFTIWMGLSVCDCVANFCRLELQLKWPNDLVLGARKLGGMLTEARIDSDHTRDLIFGLGLNVNNRTDSLPAEVAARATSLAAAAAGPLEISRLAAALIGRVLTAYERFVSGEYRAEFRAAWSARDAIRGQTVTLVQGNETFTGLADGIDDEGALLLRIDGRSYRRFRAGEVTLARPPPAAVPHGGD